MESLINPSFNNFSPGTIIFHFQLDPVCSGVSLIERHLVGGLFCGGNSVVSSFTTSENSSNNSEIAVGIQIFLFFGTSLTITVSASLLFPKARLNSFCELTNKFGYDTHPRSRDRNMRIGVLKKEEADWERRREPKRGILNKYNIETTLFAGIGESLQG